MHTCNAMRDFDGGTAPAVTPVAQRRGDDNDVAVVTSTKLDYTMDCSRMGREILLDFTYLGSSISCLTECRVANEVQRESSIAR
ncbi:hypothetical protein Syun_029475 [Stephania yunnanensis]|uniref:Uncharacterized protein n=1 Tax=Stephania yunnanensis TaxID=152371 RepID=A0AAP0E5P3_9MAGN